MLSETGWTAGLPREAVVLATVHIFLASFTNDQEIMPLHVRVIGKKVPPPATS